MAITVYEKPTSRDSVLNFDRGSTITYQIFAIATSNETETQVISAVASLTSYFYTGFATLEAKSIKVRPLGGTYWEGLVEFGEGPGPYEPGTQDNNSAADAGDQPDPNDTQQLDNSVNFEIGGGTTHIVQSRKTVSQVGAAGIIIPATNNLIGINNTNNRIDGVDIHSPTFSFTKTWTAQSLTLGYLKCLRWLVGTVNNGAYLSFPSGELLLDGVSGQWRAGQTTNAVGSWQMSARFLVEKNQQNITVGAIPAFNKNGWDYMWFGYQNLKDVATGFILPTPVYVSVERVYYYTNFKQLQIPGT